MTQLLAVTVETKTVAHRSTPYIGKAGAIKGRGDSGRGNGGISHEGKESVK